MTNSSTPSEIECRPRSPGGNVTSPEVETAVEHLTGDLPRMYASHLDLSVRMRFAELYDNRQQHVHRRLVHADEHAAASEFLQFTHRALGFIFSRVNRSA